MVRRVASLSSKFTDSRGITAGSKRAEFASLSRARRAQLMVDAVDSRTRGLRPEVHASQQGGLSA